MAQNPPEKKKRKLPKDALERNDHDLMECIFGKRIMKAIDKVVAERSKDDESESEVSMQ